MFEIKDCGDYEEAKKLIREYSEIKGAERCDGRRRAPQEGD